MNSRGRAPSNAVVGLSLAALLGMLVTAALPGARPAFAAEADACITPAVAAIQGRYQAIRDLSAHFEQTTRSVALGTGSGASKQSSGRVQFAKPGRMRWSYEAPEPSLVVSDGKTLWIYDPSHREAQRLAVSDGYLSGVAIEFLLGEGDILREFRVTADACGDDSVELTLVPRQPATYERIQIRADSKTGDVVWTRIDDLLGNTTEVRFSEIQVNRDPGADVFRFVAPDGVKVMDLDPVDPGAGSRK